MMKRMHTVALAPLGLSLLVLSGCVDAAQFVQGKPLDTLTFRPKSDTEGVFPDVSVLVDPDNPFADVAYRAIDAVNNQDAIQWRINTTAAHVAKFYVWATILAKTAPEGSGEAQYYTAVGLRDTFYFEKADPKDLPRVRDMALAAYAVVLNQFGEKAVTYDASGKIPFELVTPSLQAILDLGGLAPVGWTLVKDANGVPKAVRQ